MTVRAEKSKINKCHRSQTIKQTQNSALPADLRQTDGGKADFEGVDANGGRCTFQSVHFDGSMFAGCDAGGSRQLSSSRQIKTQDFFYLQECVSPIFPPRRFVRVHIERIRRMQVGTTGLKI